MKKKIFWGLVTICAFILIVSFGNQLFVGMFNLSPKSGLKITSNPEAVVSINGLEVGKTPYQDENLGAGEYLIRLVNGDSNWQGIIKLTKGTLSVVNRQLAPSIASSSGENLVLDKGQGIIITSSPDFSEVKIDSKDYGITPISVSNLSAGEHNISLSHNGYNQRDINIILPANSKLHINVDLAMAEIKLNNAPTPTVTLIQKIIIKQTPLGYLRIREKPTVSSKEIGQVSTGDELVVVEEVPGWIKIKLKDNQEGYISTQYIQRLTQ